MKKNLFPVIALALAFVGCADDDSSVVGAIGAAQDNKDAVALNVYASTTKGTDATTATLEGSKEVLLHIDDSEGITQSYKFVYKQTDASDPSSPYDWTQEVAKIKWGDVSFPACFYSLHDGAALALTFDDDTDDDVNFAQCVDYPVPAGKSSAHKDLVYHASKLNAIPTGGAVSAYHKHALSKVNLYAKLGANKLYIARVQLVDVDSKGTVTITPLPADQIATANGVAWSALSTPATYEYFYIGDEDVAEAKLLETATDGANPMINTEDNAPMMIIPQTTTLATITTNPAGPVATVAGSYVEVIYYMTDSEDMPIVGYSDISAMPNATKYEDDNQTLYVKSGFPLGETFDPNKVYDVTLGLGAKGTSGGILITDYYVDKDGDPIELTLAGCKDKETPEVPEIEEGEEILGGEGDYVDIVVDVHDWTAGGSYDIGASANN